MAAVVLKMQIDETLEKVFAKQNPEDTRLWVELKQLHRVQPGFHVTLMHRSSSKENPELWAKYKAIHEQAGSAENKLGDCEIMLERVSV
jgi:tRNA ligase